MIQANEIRVGNLVNVKIVTSTKWTIKTIGCQDIVRIFEEIGVFEYDPIPLTEEWLVKLGYNKCSIRHNHYVIKGHTIWLCQEMFLCDKNGIIIKHVHQLQNLYFALTNTELTSK